jgi:hypothetical protein
MRSVAKTRFDALLNQGDSEKNEGHQPADARKFYMKPEKYKKLRVKALDEGKDVTKVINELVDRWLADLG